MGVVKTNPSRIYCYAVIDRVVGHVRCTRIHTSTVPTSTHTAVETQIGSSMTASCLLWNIEVENCNLAVSMRQIAILIVKNVMKNLLTGKSMNSDSASVFEVGLLKGCAVCQAKYIMAYK